MQKGYTLKYPRMLLVLSTFIIAYILIEERHFAPLHSALSSLGYFGFLIAGTFYTYGLTSAPATALLIILGNGNGILLPGLIAGLGALLGDLFIFKFFKYTLDGEVAMLAKEKPIAWISKKIPEKAKKYLYPAVAFLAIASPLPDEIGVFMLAEQDSISTKMFSVISYVANTAGIIVILWAAHVL